MPDLDGGIPWGTADLSSHAALAAKLAPNAGAAVRAAYPDIRAELHARYGPIGAEARWQLLHRALDLLVEPGTLGLVLRVVLETVLGMAFPWLRLLFPVLEWLLARVKFLPGFLPGVADTDRFVAMARAAVALAATPPQQLSVPARVGLGLTPQPAQTEEP